MRHDRDEDRNETSLTKHKSAGKVCTLNSDGEECCRDSKKHRTRNIVAVLLFLCGLIREYKKKNDFIMAGYVARIAMKNIHI